MYAQALDTLALHLPTKMVLPPALAFARQKIGSPSRDERWAACSVALVVAEGCADGLRRKLPEVLEVRLDSVMPAPCASCACCAGKRTQKWPHHAISCHNLGLMALIMQGCQPQGACTPSLQAST